MRSISAADVSASGLSAERLRMEVVADNIANANTTRTPEGGPYRRREVVFSSAYENALRASPSGEHELRGVHVVGVRPDSSELPQVYRPAHPDADGNGYVAMPNVHLAHEMVDLVAASRSYEANLKALRTYRQMAESTLSLLRAG